MDRLLRSRRIGIDLDTKNRFKLLKAYFNAIYFLSPVQIRVTETKHGYHLRIYVKKQLTYKQKLLIRAILGDDEKRLWVDYKRLKAGNHEDIDTLFNVKSRFKEIEINPLAEQFYSITPFNTL